MLAKETMAISNFLKEIMAQKDNKEDTKNMANTRDTLAMPPTKIKMQLMAFKNKRRLSYCSRRI